MSGHAVRLSAQRRRALGDRRDPAGRCRVRPPATAESPSPSGDYLGTPGPALTPACRRSRSWHPARRRNADERADHRIRRHPPTPVRQEWLDRWHEEILEPDLPIVDPHHHLWDRAGLALPARRTAGRPEQRPQHRRDRLRAVPGDVPRRRPRGAAPGRRDRVRQRHRRDERQRRLRPDARSAPASSATPTCASARRCARCWRRTSAPAAGASAASGTSRPGTTHGAAPGQRAARPACSPIRASARASRSWRRSASRSTPGSTTRRSTS